jgi:hypothetical protein
MTTFSAFLLPPKEYSVDYMNRLVRQIEISMRRLHAGQPIRAGSDLSQTITPYPISALTLENIPTSPTGLPSGSVWSDGGTLKIVS